MEINHRRHEQASLRVTGWIERAVNGPCSSGGTLFVVVTFADELQRDQIVNSRRANLIIVRRVSQ